MSYSRNDSQDKYLRKFFDDLSEEVSGRAGVEKSQAGFLDVNQPAGTLWPDTTGRALATCRVFIPMYSPFYFESKYCGREFYGFLERLQKYEAPSRLTLPVWWLPVNKELPDSVRYIQDTRDQFDKSYRADGLRHIIRLSEFEKNYTLFLSRFAAMVVNTGEGHRLPEGEVPNLLTCPDIFNVGRQNSLSVPLSQGGFGRGPKCVHFILFAGTRNEMQSVRSILDYYGEESDEWRPYAPDKEEPLGVGTKVVPLLGADAQKVATANGFMTDIARAEDMLIEFIKKAQERREIVILLVDAWAVRLENYKKLLKEYDSYRF